MATEHYLYCLCEVSKTEFRYGDLSVLFGRDPEFDLFDGDLRRVGFSGFYYYDDLVGGDVLSFMAKHWALGHIFIVVDEYNRPVLVEDLERGHFFETWPWLRGRVVDKLT